MVCKIDSLVIEKAASLDEQCSVQEAAEIMSRENVGSLVVTRGGRVCGLFTERDLLRRVVGEDRDPKQLPLSEVCTRNLIAIDHDSTCEQAIRLMHSNLCRRLVVNRGEHFYGMLNLSDVASAMAERGGKKDLVVNLFGAITVAVAICVIVLLILQLPAMLELVERVGLP